jgi:hypothetical protein
MMTITQALHIAQGRVSIVSQGRDYVLHTWSPTHNATWTSHAMTRPAAQAAAYETKIRIALELLEVEDAGAIANVAVDRIMGDPTRPDWRKVARAEYQRSVGGA